LSRSIRWHGHNVIDFGEMQVTEGDIFVGRLVRGLLESGWCTAIVGCDDVDYGGKVEWRRLLAEAASSGSVVVFNGGSDVPLCWNSFLNMFEQEDARGKIKEWLGTDFPRSVCASSMTYKSDDIIEYE